MTEEDVSRLGSDDLVDVIHQLLWCEAHRLGISRPDLYSTTRITVADGGRDLGWENPLPEAIAYIPTAKTFYQSKATSLSDNDIKNELLNGTKNGLKPRVSEVLLNGGSYVFVTTDSWIKRSTDNDIEAIGERALKSVGVTKHPDSKIKVLGREKIAEWINCYPSVVALVLRKTSGFPDIHLFDVGSWGETREISGPYVMTPRLLEVQNQVRTLLFGSPGEILRLTGLSGIGKTRLAYEAVHAQVENDVIGKRLQASTSYLNYEDHKDSIMNLVTVPPKWDSGTQVFPASFVVCCVLANSAGVSDPSSPWGRSSL